MRSIGIVFVALVVGACSSVEERPKTHASVAPSPETAADPGDWRRPRYIPVREAVARLARHVDVPVVLPRDHLSVRNYRGWLADPNDIEWRRHRGVTVGSLHVMKGKDHLWISYGYAIPDGCGGRDTAIPTEVRGDPALLWAYDRDHSSIIWPVRRHGRIGRFELSGSFAGFQILRLAESMETKIRAAASRDPGC